VVQPQPHIQEPNSTAVDYDAIAALVRKHGGVFVPAEPPRPSQTKIQIGDRPFIVPIRKPTDEQHFPPELPKPSVPKPEVHQEPTPTVVEDSKPPVTKPNLVEIEKQADALFEQGRYNEAAPLFEQVCGFGNMKSCHFLGLTYMTTNPTRTVELWSKACDGGYLQSCDLLAGAYVYGRNAGSPGEVYQAVILFTKACDGGEAAGCADLGYLYQKGDKIQKDKGKAKQFNDRAIQLYSKACTAGDEEACGALKKIHK
jgi:hypothetical protein